MKTKTDIYQEVTDRIIDQLEKGVVPWKQTWVGGAMNSPRRLVEENYKGINVVLLGMQQIEKGYDSSYWATYKQWEAKKAQVKKGEKATKIVFWKFIEKEVEKSDGKMKTKKFPLIKTFSVFNACQCDNVPEKYIPKKVEEKEFNELIKPQKMMDDILEKLKLNGYIEGQESQAYFSPSLDTINMPKRTFFENEEYFYSTFYHESIHATGSENRLERLANEDYSKEELTAEIGACFLNNLTGIKVTEKNNVAYIKGWLSKLKNDKKLIIGASGKAQKAVDYLTA